MAVLTLSARRSLLLTSALAGVGWAGAAGAQDLPELPNVVEQSVPGDVTPADYDNSTPAATFDLGTSQRTVIEWQTFNIADGFSLEFLYTGAANGAVLNRVVGAANTGSFINGGLIGPDNLAIYLLNAEGITFGTGANVNVGSLVASTVDLRNPGNYAPFMTGGTMALAGGTTQLRVQGTASIQTRDTAGLLALLGAAVQVTGGTLISAGDLVVVAGEDISLSAPGSPLALSVTKGTALSNPIIVSGSAEGRNVTMAFATQAAVTDALLSVDGLVRATGVAVTDGVVRLVAGNGTSGVAAVSGGSGAESIDINFGIEGQAVNLRAADDITQEPGTGYIDAGILTGSAGGTVGLTGANEISTLGAFSAGNGFALNDAGGLTVAGQVNGGTGATRLTTTGLLTLSSVVRGASVELTSTGLSQGAGLAVTATNGDILIDANDGAVTLNGLLSANAIAGGDVTIRDAAAVQIASIAAGSAGTITLGQAGGDAVGAITLRGALTGQTVTGNSTGLADLRSAFNAIDRLGPFDAAGGLMLTDAGGLTVTGDVDGGAGATAITTTGLLALNADVAGTGVTLTSTGLTQIASTAVTATAGNILIDANDGSIDLHGSLDASALAGGGVTIRDAGDVSLGRVAAGATGAVVLGQAGGDAVGNVTQRMAMSGGTLSGFSTGLVTLRNAANVITNLGVFTTANGLSLTDTGGLTVTGAVNGGVGLIRLETSGLLQTNAAITGANVGLTTTGAGNSISIRSAVNAATGTVTLTSAAGIGQTAGGVINAATLTGSSVGATDLDDATNAITDLGSFTATEFRLRDAGGLSVKGNVTASSGPLEISTTGMLTSQALLTGGQVSLVSTGFTQNAGATVAATNGNILIDANDGAVTSNALLNASATAGGSVTIRDAATVQIGRITAGSSGTITLGGAGGDAVGAVSQSGPISGGTLTGNSSGAVVLRNAGNAVGTLGAFSAASGLALTDVGGLVVTGAVNSGSSDLVLSTSGDLVTNAALTGPNIALTTSGAGNGIQLNAATGAAGGTVTLVSADSIGQSAAGVITAATLTGSSAGATDLDDATNAVASLGAFSATDFALKNAGALAVTGALTGRTGAVAIETSGLLALAATVSGASVALTSTGLTQNGVAAVTASNGDITIDANDGAVTLGSALTADAMASGNVTIIDAAAVQLSRVAAGSAGTIRLGAAGGDAVGAVTQTAAISGGTLTGVSTGAVTLQNAGNAIANLGMFTAANGLALTDVGGLTVTGAVDGGAGTVALSTSGDLDVDASISGANVSLTTTGAGNGIQLNAATSSAGGTVMLVSADGIGQSAAGVVTAGTLTGSSVGATDLDDADNLVGNLGTFAATGFALNDLGGLAVTGVVNGRSGDIRLTTSGDLNVVAGGSLVTSGQGDAYLTSTGIIGLAAPLSIADDLVMMAADYAGVALSTPGVGDDVTITDTSGGLTMGGNLTVAGALRVTVLDGGSLTVTGNIASTNEDITLETVGGGAMQFDGRLTALNAANGAVRLTSTSSIGQSAGGVISTTMLTGTSSGATDLDAATNSIGTLGSFAATGFALNDVGGLTVVGAVDARSGAASIATNGPLALAESVNGASVELTGRGVMQGAGLSVTATAGDVLIDGSDGAVTLAGLVHASAPLAGGNVTVRDAAAVQLHVVTAGSAGTIALGQGGGDAVGDVTQTGAISGGTLTGNSTGAVTLDNAANAVTNLGGFTAANGLTLTDVGGLTVTGAVSGGGGNVTLETSGDLTTNASVGGANVALTTTGANNGIQLNAAINATSAAGGTVRLTSADSISQSATGIITAATLTGSSVNLTDLTAAANAVTNLGAFEATGFALNDVGGLTVTGAVNGRTGTVGLTTSGDLTTNAAVSGAGVALTTTGAGSDILLNAATNAVGGTVEMVSSATIGQTADGVITADVLTGSSAGATDLDDATNAVTSLGAFSATGFALKDADGLTVTGALTGQTGAVAIETSGLLALAATAGGASVMLTSTGLTQNGVAAVTASNGDIMIDANDGAVMLGSALTARSLTASGLDIGSITIIDAAAVQLSRVAAGSAGTIRLGAAGVDAVGDVTQTAAISGGTLTGVSTGTVMLQNSNNALTNLGVFTAANGLALTDTGSLTVTGAVDAGTGTVDLDVAGLLAVNAAVAGEGVTLTSTGLTSGAMGTVDARSGTLAIDANGAAVMLGASLTSANTGADAIAITDASTVTLHDIRAVAGGLVLGAPMEAVTGSVSQVVGTSLIANRLTGMVLGAVTLANSGNSVNFIDGFSAGSGFELTDTVDAQGLTVTDELDAGTGALTLRSTAIAFPGTSLLADGQVLLEGGASIIGGTVRSRASRVDGIAGLIDIGFAGAALDVELDAGTSIAVGTAMAGTDIDLDAGMSISIGQATTTTGNLSLLARDGALTLGTGTIGGTALLDKRGGVESGDLTITTGLNTGLAAGTAAGSGNATIRSTTNARIAQITASDGTILITVPGATTGVGEGGRANLTAPGAMSDVVIAATVGTPGAPGTSAVLGAVSAGRDISVTEQTLDVTSASAGRDVALQATAGNLTAGTLAAVDDIVLRASGAVSVTASATTGGSGAFDQAGVADVLAGATQAGNDLDVMAANLSVNEASVAVGATTALAQSSDLRLTATSGALMLGTGNVGGSATLIKQGASGGLTVGTSLTTRRAGGAGAITIDSATSVALGVIDTNILPASGNRDLTSAANSGTTIAITTNEAALNGLVRAETLRIVNATGTVNATRLGDGVTGGAAGTLALDDAELDRIIANVLTIDSGSQNVETGGISFTGAAGSRNINIYTTGRVDGTGLLTASGSGRVLQIGGTSAAANPANNATLASVIRFAATESAGGRIMLDGGMTLDLRAQFIGFGLDGNFLSSLGLNPGGTPLTPAVVASTFVGQPSSSLYGVVGYTNFTLLQAATLRVTYSNFGLFQNTATRGLPIPSGVVIGSLSVTPLSVALGSTGDTAMNAFAIFGSVNGRSGTSAALLGPDEVGLSGVNRSFTRINGCLVQSGGGGCLITSFAPPQINVFEADQAELLNPSSDFIVSVDPLIGAGNEALLGSIDAAPSVARECAPGSTDPACPTSQGVRP